ASSSRSGRGCAAEGGSLDRERVGSGHEPLARLDRGPPAPGATNRGQTLDRCALAGGGGLAATSEGSPRLRPASSLARDGLQDLLGDVEVRVDVLHVVVVLGTSESSADSTAKPAASIAPRTAARLSGALVTWKTSPSASTSSAPASAAARKSSSSSTPSPGTTTTPRRSNCHATAPVVPSEPPCLVNAWRTSEAVRFRLSVSASTITATPSGPYPS